MRRSFHSCIFAFGWMATLSTGALTGAADAADSTVSMTLNNAEDVPGIVEAAIAKADKAVAAIVAVPQGERTFDNTVRAMDDLEAQLELDTNMVQFMAYVSTDAEEREAGEAAARTLSEWSVGYSQNEALSNAVEAFVLTPAARQLIGEDKRLLRRKLRDFRRSGMALLPEERARLAELRNEESSIGIEFNANIRNDETRVPLTRDELEGLPESWFEQIPVAGDMYLVGLSYPEYLPVLKYGDDADTRQKMWLAAKRQGGTQNVRLLERALRIRAEAASLLGYAHAADYETDVLMAKTASTVEDFYATVRPLVREKALVDMKEYESAKATHLGESTATLYPWDLLYYETRLRRDKFSVDPQEVQQYFPIDAVIDGWMKIVGKLFAIALEDVTDQADELDLPLWHEDVRLFAVSDANTGEVFAHIYFDLHPRPGKFTHAAQWGLRQRKEWADGSVTLPLAALVCNFTRPTADRPALLTHDEVETFFHEVGHGLHTMFSTGKHWTFAGTGVERDFVEAPSQIMENWVWDAGVLGTFARHWETGAPFPDDLLQRMIAAKNLGSGISAERQFYYGLYSLMTHTSADGEVDTTQLAMELNDPAGMHVELFAPVENTIFQASFGHLMGYNSGYYGYQWSLVFSCDMFERMKEGGNILSAEAGSRLRDFVLSQGGRKDGDQLVRDYLGRDPDMTAYLRHLGLSTDSSESPGSGGE